VPARFWVTSHHKGIVTERAHFIVQLAAFEAVLDRRDAALLDALHEGPKSLAELATLRFVYRRGFVAPFVHDVESRSIEQHLTALMSQGAVGKEEETFFLR